MLVLERWLHSRSFPLAVLFLLLGLLALSVVMGDQPQEDVQQVVVSRGPNVQAASVPSTPPLIEAADQDQDFSELITKIDKAQNTSGVKILSIKFPQASQSQAKQVLTITSLGSYTLHKRFLASFLHATDQVVLSELKASRAEQDQQMKFEATFEVLTKSSQTPNA